MELTINFPPKKGKSPSHVSMRGGIHFVPPDREDEFFRTYTRLVDEGSKLYLVEQCNTKEFKFFLDIDLKAPEALSIKQITDICIRISKIVDGGKSVILVAKPKPVGDEIKSGIHMVWFNYIVELEEAYKMRDTLVRELGDDYNWEGILDTSVYRAGIRLPAVASRISSMIAPRMSLCETSGPMDSRPILGPRTMGSDMSRT